MDNKKRCPCGGELEVILRNGGIHYADLRCKVCGKHRGFAPKPDNVRRLPPLEEVNRYLQEGR